MFITVANIMNNYCRCSSSCPLLCNINISEPLFAELPISANRISDDDCFFLFVTSTKYNFLAANKTAIGKVFPSTLDMDYRFKWWIENTGSYYILSKYNTSKRGPMLKVSEMYLILAETASSVSEKEEWLNTLLYHRGLPNENLSDVDVNSRLLQEYAKEFIGEGQIFFAYKGLNCNKTPVTNTTVADPETPINLRRSILRQAYQSFTAKVKTGRKKPQQN